LAAETVIHLVSDEEFDDLRARMMAEIATEAALTAPDTGKAAFSGRVMRAIGNMPRHAFVPVELRPYAYFNRPLPIGYDKTISQPFIVALMTDLLDIESSDKVLEIGAGTGYQAAVLAELASQVYSIDIIDELARGAKECLRRLGYANVEFRVANGYYGWAEHAPYDKIMVTAACELIPPALITELKPGGRMVIPTGVLEKQALTLVEKSRSGRLTTRDVLPVRFSELEEPGGPIGWA